MNVSSAKYTVSHLILAVIDGLEIFVPDDIDNGHRIMLAEWEAEGNAIAPYVEPILTPEEKRALMPKKSMVEFRANLREVRTQAFPEGIYADDINAMIDLIPDRSEREGARDYFNLGQYVERTHPLVDAFGANAGLTPEDIDILWMGGEI